MTVGAATSRLEQLAEGAPEVDVEDGVDERVERRVDVAEPHDEVDRSRVRVAAARRAERHRHVHQEERKPAENERTHHDGHRARRATFARQRDALLFGEELRQVVRTSGSGREPHRPDPDRRVVGAPLFYVEELHTVGLTASGVHRNSRFFGKELRQVVRTSGSGREPHGPAADPRVVVVGEPGARPVATRCLGEDLSKPALAETVGEGATHRRVDIALLSFVFTSGCRCRSVVALQPRHLDLFTVLVKRLLLQPQFG